MKWLGLRNRYKLSALFARIPAILCVFLKNFQSKYAFGPLAFDLMISLHNNLLTNQ